MKPRIKTSPSVRRVYRNFDVVLTLLVVGLCVFGLVIIPSAAEGLGYSPGAFKMQRFWVASGVLIMLAAAFIDYQFICKFYIPIFIINIALLLATFALKKILNRDILREIGYPFYAAPQDMIISIMPSEFAKLFMIISLAKFIDVFRHKINNVLVVGAVLAATGLTFFLIAMQPSLSASLVIVFIMIVMLYAAKLSYRYFIIAALIVIPLIILVSFDISSEDHKFLKMIGMKEYQIERLADNPDSRYQAEKSQEAISSGRLTGNGLKSNPIYVPESTNDFIFAVIGSEFGFFGTMAVVLCGFLIVFKCLITAWRSEIFLGKMLASGVGALFAFHIFLNVGVNTGIMPNTGITFPFISVGGSSIWINMACIGLVLNVGMTKTKSIFEK